LQPQYFLRFFEILFKTPLRFALGRIFPAREPRVFFGYERIPGRSEPAAGGLVKLQDLVERHPNARWRANTLYLISSALPWTARWQVRCARFWGARVILNQNGVAYPAWLPEGWEEENRRKGWIYQQADGVIHQSEFCRRSAERFLGERTGKAETLLNPVDLTSFSPREPSTDPPEPFRLLLAGTHQFAYRVRVAVETLQHLPPEIVLVIRGRLAWAVSEEQGWQEVGKWAEEGGVQARMICEGSYSQREAVEMFRSCHLLLHPQSMDACPRLVAEALASGLPVVGPANGGLPEMVRPEAGVLVPLREDFAEEQVPDPHELAAAVRKVRADHASYRAGARRCAEERFDREPWLAAHDRIFREVLGSSS
jgi:glycosyltransferase involved in cell wall biosynthesis